MVIRRTDWDAGNGGAYVSEQDPWPTLGGDTVLHAIEAAASVLCKRWKPAILYLLANDHHRYNELLRRLPGVTPKMLTQQLKELEQDGLLHRTEHNEGRKHVEYALTDIGDALRPVIAMFEVWGRQYEAFRDQRETAASAPVHDRERVIAGDHTRSAGGEHGAAYASGANGSHGQVAGRISGRASNPSRQRTGE